MVTTTVTKRDAFQNTVFSEQKKQMNCPSNSFGGDRTLWPFNTARWISCTGWRTACKKRAVAQSSDFLEKTMNKHLRG